MKWHGLLLIVAITSLLDGCATPFERQSSAFREEATAYINHPSSPAYKEHPYDEVMFFDLSKIARKYGQTQYEAVFLMLRDEAAKKHYGLPNQYDDLRARFDQNDQSLPRDAVAYHEDATIRDKCASFGYAIDSAPFNQCVYKLRLDMATLQIQMMQSFNTFAPAPKIDLPPQPTPPSSQPRYTHCQGLAGTARPEFSCYTR